MPYSCSHFVVWLPGVNMIKTTTTTSMQNVTFFHEKKNKKKKQICSMRFIGQKMTMAIKEILRES